LQRRRRRLGRPSLPEQQPPHDGGPDRQHDREGGEQLVGQEVGEAAEVLEVADEIRGEGCDSLAIEADISNESDCFRLVEEANKAFGRIDVLVNNAGIQTDVPFEETTTQEWYRIIGVDLTGPFVCGREVAKHMEKQHPKGGVSLAFHQFIKQYRSRTTFLMLPQRQV